MTWPVHAGDLIRYFQAIIKRYNRKDRKGRKAILWDVWHTLAANTNTYFGGLFLFFLFRRPTLIFGTNCFYTEIDLILFPKLFPTDMILKPSELSLAGLVMWEEWMTYQPVTTLDFKLSWSSHKEFEGGVPAQGNKVSSTTSVSEAKKNTAWSKSNVKRNPYWCSQCCGVWMRGNQQWMGYW